jgi:hypothetical protein
MGVLAAGGLLVAAWGIAGLIHEQLTIARDDKEALAELEALAHHEEEE